MWVWTLEFKNILCWLVSCVCEIAELMSEPLPVCLLRQSFPEDLSADWFTAWIGRSSVWHKVALLTLFMAINLCISCHFQRTAQREFMSNRVFTLTLHVTHSHKLFYLRPVWTQCKTPCSRPGKQFPYFHKFSKNFMTLKINWHFLAFL